MRGTVAWVTATCLSLVIFGACASNSQVETLAAENTKSQADFRVLRQSLDRQAALADEQAADIANLERALSELKNEVGSRAARDILGAWSRETPQLVRVRNNYSALRQSSFEPGPGADSQLNWALVRIANVAALTLIGDEMRYEEQTRQLEILNQCMEYLLGINSASRSCDLEPISP